MKSFLSDRPPDRVSWRSRLMALRNVWAVLQMLWQISPPRVLGTIFFRICRALMPVSTLWVSKLILDAIVARILHKNGDLIYIWKLVGLQFILAFAADVFGRAQTLVESLLADELAKRISVRLIEHAITLDQALFEDPTFCDKLARARNQTSGRLDLLASVLNIVQDTLSLASLSAGLILFAPWLMLLLVVAVIPVFLGEIHFAKLGYSIMYRRTPERRLLDYILFLGTSAQSAKEVKIFGFGRFLYQRYDEISKDAIKENATVSRKRAIFGSALNLISSGGYYGAYGLVLARTLAGTITVGMFTFLSGAFMRSHGYIERILLGFSNISSQALFLKDLFDFFETKPTIRAVPEALAAPRPIKAGFQFEDVSFAYPGSDQLVVHNLNFKLHPNEKLALIGTNGAGKTTVVKLMTRLYDPTEGRILLDGIDLREYDPDDLRREVGVIFQDYVRYDMMVRENIGIGRIDALADEFRIISAARKSLANDLIDRLPNGYNQMVGKRFEGGVDLSGGEWQKLALARAHMCDAQIVILDEPTSGLDAQAEHEMFERFAELTRGRMAVFISHRFSTVRMADRILVLDKGTIREEGTHEQLVVLGGHYSRLFDLQAAGYR